MKKYLNMKSDYGTETIDELDSEDFNSYREFRTELRRLISEYHTAGMRVYSSGRCVRDWESPAFEQASEVDTY